MTTATHEFVTRAAQARRTETPNAVMTTLASPTQGGTTELSLWRAEMRAGQQGPRHLFATEQIWSVLKGKARIVVGNTVHDLAEGDTIVLVGGEVRQVTATTDVSLIVCGRGDAEATVAGEHESRGIPPWIA